MDEQELAVVKQAYGYSVSLVCAVEAFPPADITWSHQNILVSKLCYVYPNLTPGNIAEV